MAAPAAVYRPRNPQDSDYYRCVENNFACPDSQAGELKKLEVLFRHKVLRMLLNKGNNLAGDDRLALNMAAFRLQRLLRQSHLARR
jgi:hypothetical protein